MVEKKMKTVEEKKGWWSPEVKDFGKIEDVTTKSLGMFDGSGLEHTIHHPSM